MRALSQREREVADSDTYANRTRVSGLASLVRFVSDRVLPWNGDTLTLQEYREAMRHEYDNDGS